MPQAVSPSRAIASDDEAEISVERLTHVLLAPQPLLFLGRRLPHGRVGDESDRIDIHRDAWLNPARIAAFLRPETGTKITWSLVGSPHRLRVEREEKLGGVEMLPSVAKPGTEQGEGADEAALARSEAGWPDMHLPAHTRVGCGLDPRNPQRDLLSADTLPSIRAEAAESGYGLDRAEAGTDRRSSTRTEDRGLCRRKSACNIGSPAAARPHRRSSAGARPEARRTRSW